MLPLINPGKLTNPFDHAGWIFEVKFDGFRAAADTVHGRLISRNSNWMHRFDRVLDLLPKGHVFDGELVVLDDAGRPLFNELFARRRPTYVAFDLLMGKTASICAPGCSSNARRDLRVSAKAPRAGLHSPTASSAKGGRFTGRWSMLTSRASSLSVSPTRIVRHSPGGTRS